jgi:hypothetical protein
MPGGRIEVGEELIVVERAELGTELHIEVAWTAAIVASGTGGRDCGARSWLTSSQGNGLSFSLIDST